MKNLLSECALIWGHLLGRGFLALKMFENRRLPKNYGLIATSYVFSASLTPAEVFCDFFLKMDLIRNKFLNILDDHFRHLAKKFVDLMAFVLIFCFHTPITFKVM